MVEIPFLITLTPTLSLQGRGGFSTFYETIKVRTVCCCALIQSQLSAKLQGIFIDTDLHVLLEHLIAPFREGKVN